MTTACDGGLHFEEGRNSYLRHWEAKCKSMKIGCKLPGDIEGRPSDEIIPFGFGIMKT